MINEKCCECVHCEVCAFIESETAKAGACDFYAAGFEDAISRTETIKHLYQRLYESALNNVGYECKAEDIFMDIADNRLKTWIKELPNYGSEEDKE